MANQAYITAIVPTKRDAQRATVKVNGEAVATLSQKRIAQLGIEVNHVWDDPLAEQVEAAAVFDKAMMHAMNGLSRRAMSRGEVERKLKQKQHEAPVVHAVMQRLEKLSLLDDEAFGRALIRDLQNRQPAGPRLLTQKLAEKGLDYQLIDRLVREADENTDQFEEALKLAHKRLPRLNRLNATTKRRRLHGQLARRGFEPDTIEQVMQQFVDELADDEDD